MLFFQQSRRPLGHQMVSLLERARVAGVIEVMDGEDPEEVAPGLGRAIEMGFLRDVSGGFHLGSLYQLTLSGKFAIGAELSWLEKLRVALASRLLG